MNSGLKMRVKYVIICVLISAGVTAGGVKACFDLSVRDAAYDEDRDVHLLTVIAEDGDPGGEEIFAGLEEWLAGAGQKLNLDLELVDVDAPGVSWPAYGIPSAPPAVPVVVLTGRRQATLGGMSFLVDHWEPGPDKKELDRLKTSPVREEIRKAAGRSMAVLVFIPGSDSYENSAAQVVDEVARSWSDKTPLGVPVLRVERTEAAERLLLAFLGVKDTGPPWAGVVFGRGKLMAPLVGEDITAENLNTRLETLAADCTCLQSSSSLGVDLPMEWDGRDDAEVLALKTGLRLDGSMPARTGIPAVVFLTFGGLVILVVFASFWIVRRSNGRPV
ncbi:MAG: hypothetical protein FVQ81_15055 [Candidatus Glassbacteria bacterium]|nr:hypothetical protein [Candidatus Glassbacteria bacterium]